MKLDITHKHFKTILIILLIVITIGLRLQNDHQTDFDSYWLHAMGESIELHGSALWVMHPASLFGYYPLSYPSGTPFTLAVADTLTGLGMNSTVFVISIISGLLLVFFTFEISKKFEHSWITSYIAALIVAFSPIIINYTAFNAAGRILVLVFALPFLWTLMEWYRSKKHKYLFLSIALLIFAFFAHRTAQLMIVFILAFIAAIVIHKLPNIWEYIKSHRHYKKYIHPRYEKSKYYILLDICIILLIIGAGKLADLIRRGRIDENLQSRFFEPATKIIGQAESQLMLLYIILGSILALIIIWAIYIKFVKKKKVIKSTLLFFHREYHKIFENPQKYFLILILIVTLIIFARQFFGASFYAPDLTEFYATEFLSGDQPWIVFANFVINYTTAVSPLFLLVFVGFIALLFKKHKTFNEWFLIFIFIGFSSVLLDKRYVRMFITPILTIYIAYAITSIFNFIRKDCVLHKTRKVISYLFIFFVIFIMAVGIFIPYARTTLVEDANQSSFEFVEWYWQTGQYLRSLDCNCSTVTTQELTAGVIIFASSGIPGGSHNIYYFVDRNKIVPDARTFEDIKDRLQAGSKIENLWTLPDWIFEGTYYIGRHARYLFNNKFYDEINKIIIEDYNEKFYIHDKNLETNDFLDSIVPVKNIIYDNPKAIVYQLDRGRE